DTLRLNPANAPAAGIVAESATNDENIADVIAQLQAEMLEASQALEFERAAHLRDQIRELQSGAALPVSPAPASASPKRKATSYRQTRPKKK
ncbi:MAG: UvrB/UvrC motif-containing protein, partial [Verrucomicrobiota bacterium]